MTYQNGIEINHKANIEGSKKAKDRSNYFVTYKNRLTTYPWPV